MIVIYSMGINHIYPIKVDKCDLKSFKKSFLSPVFADIIMFLFLLSGNLHVPILPFGMENWEFHDLGCS